MPTNAYVFTIPPKDSSVYLPGKRTWMPAYAISIQVFTTVLLGVRLASRFKRHGGRPGMDDLFIVLAWLLGLLLTTLAVYASIHLGWDGHMLAVPTELWWKGALVSFLSLPLCIVIHTFAND
jgi:hypothetical protein